MTKDDKYTVATDEDAKVFTRMAAVWVEESGRYNDYKSIVKCAVAEFMANQIGLTLYEKAP